MLKNKNILLAVTGSIAAYKACEITRLFVKAGANVRVVMSDDALRFVGEKTFEALSKNKVLCSNNEDWSGELNHIGLSTWADLFLIAPATANTINSLCCGLANNPVLLCAIACDKPKVIVPAMNDKMLENEATKSSIETLKSRGYSFCDADFGLLACGVNARGKMQEPMDVFYFCTRKLLSDEYFRSRTIIINSGGTIEKIDDVRYISNFSSSKMGLALAKAAYFLGADVYYLHTNDFLNLPKEIQTLKCQSAYDMQEGIEKTIASVDFVKKGYFFGASAVSDYAPEFAQKGKLKKASLGKSWSLKLHQTPDLLASIDKKNLFVVGFKAEFDEQNARKNARNMCEEKNLYAVCLNILGKDINFGSDDSVLSVFMGDEEFELSKKPKLDLGFELLQILKKNDGC